MAIVLEGDTVQDKQLASVIISYMSTKYFSNNPWYLSLWKRAHALQKTADILFLMHMKGVGAFSSWIYIKLHEHFVQKGCASCAHAILIEGIKAGAYPSEELEERVDYSVPRMHSLEKPERIKAFGKEWVHKTTYMHPEHIVRAEGENITYMEYRIIQHLRVAKRLEEEETERGLNEVSLLFGSVRPRRQSSEAPKPAKKHQPSKEEDGGADEPEDPNAAVGKDAGKERPGQPRAAGECAYEAAGAKPEPHMLLQKESGPQEKDTEGIDTSQLEIAQDMEEMYKDAFSEILAEECGKSHTDLSVRLGRDMSGSKDELYERQGVVVCSGAFGSPSFGSKVVIREMLYIVKKKLGKASFLVTRIASLGDGNVTLNAQDYVLREAADASEYSVSRALESTGFSVPVEAAVKYQDKFVLLSPYKEMGALDRAVSLISQKEGGLSELLAAHYVMEILRASVRAEKEGYSLCNCKLKDFVLVVENGKIGLRIARYCNVSTEEQVPVHLSSMLAEIRAAAKIEYTQTLLVHPLPSSAWVSKIEMYLAQKREASALQNMFIAQEVCIYESGQMD
ncbi:uncharacterized protein NEMAJ01_1279 [Nematocida major]|uniref:uncharacterized protein n=1 Tax=Nematocida major TaxID=1912982 RepID=UPI0020079D88|nr:uncharacterized protein NEMAJ01_1279 [Nematocida major]KAH9386383.1 hypothetical protein NEMAJ01_1279 [Nematocida major]